MQRAILSDGLRQGLDLAEPGTVHLPISWDHDDWKAEPLGWSRSRENAGTSGTSAGDTRTGRTDEPQYQSSADATAAAAIDWDAQCKVCVGLPD